MSAIVNFHLPADDAARAAAFYADVFGWRFVQQPETDVTYLVCEPVATGGAGVPAAIVDRQEVVKHPVPTVSVDDIDQAMTLVATRGGQQGRVREIPGVGRFGYAIDTEGNVIALVQPVTGEPRAT